MSDIFFIVATVSIIVITILLSLLLLRLIDALDEVREIVLRTKDVTVNASKAIATVATLGSIISPTLGISKLFRKRSRRKE